MADERFKSTAGLVRHADARLELMASVLRTRTTADWCERLDRAQVPCAPILTRDELLEHPQVLENAIVVESEHPKTGRMRQARPPERFERTPSAIGRAAPLLGEHTDEVLAESGYTREEIEKLRAEGAVG